MERRRWPRVPVDFPVFYSGEGTSGEGTAVDLSKGGLGITVLSEQTVAAGGYMMARLALPDQESPLRVELAAVRWSRDRLFGLELLLMGTHESDRLDRFIRTLETGPSH